MRLLPLFAILATVPVACLAEDDTGLRFADSLIAEERSNTSTQVSSILRSTNSVPWKIEALAPFVKTGDTLQHVEAAFGRFRGWGHGIGVTHGTYSDTGLYLSFMPEKPFSKTMYVYEIGYSPANTPRSSLPAEWLVRSNPAFFPNRTNATYSVMFHGSANHDKQAPQDQAKETPNSTSEGIRQPADGLPKPSM